jgi:hypothetical protein
MRLDKNSAKFSAGRNHIWGILYKKNDEQFYTVTWQVHGVDHPKFPGSRGGAAAALAAISPARELAHLASEVA